MITWDGFRRACSPSTSPWPLMVVIMVLAAIAAVYAVALHP